MVDTKPLFKGFGAAADVVGQIATDKAVNSRRTRSDFLQFDITAGQLIQDHALTAGITEVPHALGRIANGAIVLKENWSAGAVNDVVCVGTGSSTVSIRSTADNVVTLWVI